MDNDHRGGQQPYLPEEFFTQREREDNPYNQLNHFAFIYYSADPTVSSWNKDLQFLAGLADGEDWTLSEADATANKFRHIDAKYRMLDNYLVFTFAKLLNERLLAESPSEKNLHLYVDEKTMAFDTGLRTAGAYEAIFAVFNRNIKPDRQPWHFYGFFKKSDYQLNEINVLPQPASYDDLTYQRDWEFRIDYDHILDDARHILRMPESLQTDENHWLLRNAFIGAVEIARRQAVANRDLVVLTFYQDKVQLLLPLAITANQPQLALVLLPRGEYYSAPTVLTMEMAYNDARLIAKPAANWLIKGRQEAE